MLKILNILPLVGILHLILYNKKGRIIGMLYSIIIMYYSLYLLLIMNNNSPEFQFREIIDLNYIKLTLGVDGISIALILITTIIIPIIILLRERKKEEEEVEIVKLILLIESMLISFFSVLDLFYFYLLFELLLIPMFILIGKYGSKEKRVEAAYRFIIYSLVGSLIMLISIILIYLKFGTTNNEIINFKTQLLNKNLGYFIWLSFFISFAIKVPIFPFHTWLPFVHVEAPTIGSILLAAIMLKLGIYGIIRYNIDLLGEINNYFLPIIIIMSLLSIIYGSLTTIRQIDLKKIIAYSSIVHMNYAILGIYSNEIEGLIGGNYMSISHAFISSGLFLLVGLLYKRYHTRLLIYFNGLILTMPIFGTIFILLTLANLSLPLTSSFISEILIIIATIKFNLFIGILIAISLIFTTSFGFWLSNRLLFGQLSPYLNYYIDLSLNEFLALIPLLLLTIFLGINTKIIIELLSIPVLNLLY